MCRLCAAAAAAVEREREREREREPKAEKVNYSSLKAYKVRSKGGLLVQNQKQL